MKKDFKLLVTDLGGNRYLIPGLPIMMLRKHKQVTGVGYLAPASSRVPRDGCWDKLRDPRLEGTVPGLGQKAPGHSFTPLQSPTLHEEIKMPPWGPRETSLRWPCGTTGERAAGQHCPMRRRLRLVTRVHLSKTVSQ